MLVLLIVCSTHGVVAQANEWMTSLEVAQRLARRQNKMILMVWQEATEYPLTVATIGTNGRLVFVEDLFSTPELSEVLWKYFVPVRVDESMYNDLYADIKGKRSSRYINVFQDDSVKIMDANGHLVLVSGVMGENFLYLDKLIEKYALNTNYIAPELEAYATQKDFYATYYLASKYLDYSIFLKKEIRKEILDLATIYIEEAMVLVSSLNEADKKALEQQLALLPLKKDLILGRARKVIRTLNKLDQAEFKEAAQTEIAFLYYTAYNLLGDEKNVNAWQNKVSSVHLKKAQLILNINK